MSLLIVGSVAYDSIKTPFGEAEKVLGGSASYASVSASFFNSVNLVAVVGEDFPKSEIDFFNSRNINTDGLNIQSGNTFFWKGEYGYDMNEAHTLDTQLNVFANFHPILKDEYKNSEYVFLANIDPEIQLNILEQINNPKFVALDTMNLWINIKKDKLIEVISKVDILFINEAEIKQLTNEFNIIKSANKIFEYGLKYLVIKRGEYGVLFFENLDEKKIFSLPAYPLEIVKDPTGAGDSFAGGFMGYLSKADKIDEATLRKSAVIGTMMASINVEDFSLNRFKEINTDLIFERLLEFRKILNFDEISI
jgi:sugar/nucleoside kinase (ribokinase family)